MISVNTNVNAMYSQNFMRLNLNEYTEKVERLSTGLRINRGADDPSGIAISGGMRAQLHGVNEAIGNAQDTICLLQLVDDFLGHQYDNLIGVRDLCVRLANSATLSYQQGVNANDHQMSDCFELRREIEVMKDHIYLQCTNIDWASGTGYPTANLNYNGKNIFSGTVVGGGFDTGLPAQIGPDNGVAYQMQIVINDIASYFSAFAVPYQPLPGNDTLSAYETYATKSISLFDDLMNKISSERVLVGTQINTLNCAIDDLKAQYINISGANSRIEDADMTDEMTAYTKNMIKQQASNVAATQANAEPLITTKLVQAIYDGLNERMVFNAHVGPTPTEGVSL